MSSPRLLEFGACGKRKQDSAFCEDRGMNLDLLTDRLLMTPLSPNDVDLAIDIWTDPEVVRFVCEPATAQQIRDEILLTTRRGSDGSIGSWCIADKISGKKVGFAFLLPMPTTENDVDYESIVMGRMPEGDIEVGYFFIPSAWGKGFATEVCMRMLKFAFEEASFADLVASVHADNSASRRVLEKCGFRYRGRTMCWGLETPIYDLSRDEWIELEERRESRLP